ncbi:MAG: GNAT family N-acetyltransferase [Caldilineaceae bacterium]
MISTVRPMVEADVDEVARVHLLAFPNFFLSFLGERFLRELYMGILNDISGIAFVLEVNEQVCGFVAGTDNSAGLYMRLLKERWWRFGWACAGKALRCPRIVPRLLRAFSAPSDKQREPGCGLLMSLATRPDFQGKHCGRSLVDAFLVAAAQHGLHAVALTTDRDNNEHVNRFYQHLGFELAETYVTAEGRSMNEYVFNFSDCPTRVDQQPAFHAWQLPKPVQKRVPTFLKTD